MSEVFDYLERKNNTPFSIVSTTPIIQPEPKKPPRSRKPATPKTIAPVSGDVPQKRRPGRPPGSKNKNKMIPPKQEIKNEPPIMYPYPPANHCKSFLIMLAVARS